MKNTNDKHKLSPPFTSDADLILSFFSPLAMVFFKAREDATYFMNPHVVGNLTC